MSTEISGVDVRLLKPGDRIRIGGVGRAVVVEITGPSTATIAMREAWYWRPWWWLSTARRKAAERLEELARAIGSF